MPSTGQFYLLTVQGVINENGSLLQVTHVDCNCLECHRQFVATNDRGLIDLNGGAVLICPMCGNRQAVSRARLEEFRARVG